MAAQTSAAAAALHQAQGDQAQAQAQAQTAGAASTYAKLQEAAKTPGAIAPIELVQAQRQAEAAEALIASRSAAVDTAKGHLGATADMQFYLRVVAPFDGIIKERLVDPGMVVGNSGQHPC